MAERLVINNRHFSPICAIDEAKIFTLFSPSTVCFQSTCPRTYYEHLRLWILYAKEQTFTNISDECIKAETEKESVENSTGQKSTRRQAQIQNKSPEEVRSNFDLQIVALIEQC